MTERPLTTCRLCKGSKVKRLIGTGAGIIFKGSGFYCTDYRSDGYKTSATKEKTAPTSSGDSSAKTDTVKADTAKSDDTKTKAKSPAKSDASK